jgi:hypothetical protein
MLRLALLATAINALPLVKLGGINNTASVTQSLLHEHSDNTVSALSIADPTVNANMRNRNYLAAELKLRASQLDAAGLLGYDFFGQSESKETVSEKLEDEPDAKCAEKCEELSACVAWVRDGTECKLIRNEVTGWMPTDAKKVAGAPTRSAGFQDNCAISGKHVSTVTVSATRDDSTSEGEYQLALDKQCTKVCEESILCEFWVRSSSSTTCNLKRKPYLYSSSSGSRCGAPDTRVCDGAKFYDDEGFTGRMSTKRSSATATIEYRNNAEYSVLTWYTKSFEIPAGCLVSAVTSVSNGGPIRKERFFLVGAPQITKQGGTASLSDLTYKRHTGHTQGLYAMPPINKDYMNGDMLSSSVPYDYEGGLITMDNIPNLHGQKYRAFYVFGGSILRTYGATEYRGTDRQPIGISKLSGMQFPAWGLDPKSAVTWSHSGIGSGNGHSGECMTATDDNKVILSRCINGFTNQMWWKDYHPGLEGRFLIKFMVLEQEGKIRNPMCMYAKNEGNMEGVTGFYYIMKSSDVGDRRRLLGWGPCDPTNLDHQWEAEQHDELDSEAGNVQHIVSAATLRTINPVMAPTPIFGLGIPVGVTHGSEERLSLVFGCGSDNDFQSTGLCLENDRGQHFDANWAKSIWPKMSNDEINSVKVISRNSPEASFTAGSWDLAGSVHKIDADPTWPVVAYGTTIEKSQSSEDTLMIGSATEHETSIGVYAEASGGGAEAAASGSTSRSQAIEKETASTKAKEAAQSMSEERTCPLQCTIPGYVDGPANTGAFIGATNGVGYGVDNSAVSGDASLGGRAGCQTGLDDALLYIWRWRETVQTEGDSEATVSTCHVQCTCTPEPPKCKLGHCNGPFCEGPCLPLSGAATTATSKASKVAAEASQNATVRGATVTATRLGESNVYEDNVAAPLGQCKRLYVGGSNDLNTKSGTFMSFTANSRHGTLSAGSGYQCAAAYDKNNWKSQCTWASADKICTYSETFAVTVNGDAVTVRRSDHATWGWGSDLAFDCCPGTGGSSSGGSGTSSGTSSGRPQSTEVLKKQCNFGTHSSDISTAYDANGCDAHCNSDTVSITIGNTVHRPSSMGSFIRASGAIARATIPMGCAVRVYLANEEYTDYLHDFTSACTLQASGVAFFGYDPSHDNRVLVMDQHAEKAGDMQNACRGQLMEPGAHKKVDMSASSYSMKVLGGAKATMFTKGNFLGDQRDLGRGLHMAFMKGPFSMQVHGHGTVRAVSLQASWQLAGTVDRDNSAPEWPTIEMGVSFDSERSHEEEEEMSESVAWGIEAEISVGFSIEVPVVEIETSGGRTMSHSSSWQSSQGTARATASAIGNSRETTLECALTCPVPAHNQAAKGQGEMLFVEDGVGRDCPDAQKGNQLYIWRWHSKATLPSPGEAGTDTMNIATCHTQCTCTPSPPRCDFTQCADAFCTYCKGEPKPSMTGTNAGQHYPKDQVTGSYVANSAPGGGRSSVPGSLP